MPRSIRPLSLLAVAGVLTAASGAHAAVCTSEQEELLATISSENMELDSCGTFNSTTLEVIQFSCSEECTTGYYDLINVYGVPDCEAASNGLNFAQVYSSWLNQCALDSAATSGSAEASAVSGSSSGGDNMATASGASAESESSTSAADSATGSESTAATTDEAPSSSEASAAAPSSSNGSSPSGSEAASASASGNAASSLVVRSSIVATAAVVALAAL